MGYTHYFPQTGEIDADTFRRIGQDLNAIIETGDDRVPPIAFESDQDYMPPLISADLIRFNGVGSDGHETFYLPIDYEPRGWFNFCKTARKPYDILVCAALLIAHHHAPEWLNIGSDGEPTDVNPNEYPNEWLPARLLIADILGYMPEYPAGILGDASEPGHPNNPRNVF